MTTRRQVIVATVLALSGCGGDGGAEGGWWRPEIGTSFQIQFAGPLDLAVEADVYDIDLYDAPEDAVASLHEEGRRVLCYVNVGAWEEWRPDAGDFPEDVLGDDYAGWPGERWVDIRRLDALGPIIEARLDRCAAQGFDGVDPDNVNGFENASGFPLTAGDQLAFNRWLAAEAHERGLAIGLKNDEAQAGELVEDFDFAVTEDCAVYESCELMAVFVDAGKPVFQIEYTDTDVAFAAACEAATDLGSFAVLKHRELDAFIETCP